MRATKIVSGVGAAAAAQWGAARLLTVMTQRATSMETEHEVVQIPRQRAAAEEPAAVQPAS